MICDEQGSPQTTLLWGHWPAQTLPRLAAFGAAFQYLSGNQGLLDQILQRHLMPGTVSPLQPPDTACSGITGSLGVPDPLSEPLSSQVIPLTLRTVTTPFCLPSWQHQGLGSGL